MSAYYADKNPAYQPYGKRGDKWAVFNRESGPNTIIAYHKTRKAAEADALKYNQTDAMRAAKRSLAQ